MIQIICRLDENKYVGLLQPGKNKPIGIYHLNEEEEFVGVGEIDPKELAMLIEELLPMDKRNMWR